MSALTVDAETEFDLEQAAPSRLPRALTPFRYAAYRRLAVALVLSSFASGVWVVAQVWRYPDRWWTGATVRRDHRGAVGVLLPALLGGVVADRVPQKQILLCVATLELAGIGLVALLSVTDATQLWHLAAVVFMTGVGFAFYYPAYSAWLPALVPDSDLQAVNGFEGVVRPSVQQALGPAVAGAVVASFSAGAALVLATIFALGGLLALTTVPLTPVRRDLAAEPDADPVGAALADLREGLRIHGPDAVAAGHPALRIPDDPRHHGAARGTGPLPRQGPARRRPKRPRDGAGSVRCGRRSGFTRHGSLRMPRRYLTTMILMWGLGCLPFVVMGMATAVWMIVASAFVVGAMFSAPMVIWEPCCSVGFRHICWVERLVGLLRLDQPDAGVDGVGGADLGAGRPRRRSFSPGWSGGSGRCSIVWARLPADEIACPLRDDEVTR